MAYLLLIIYSGYTIRALSFRGLKAVKYLTVVCFFQNIVLMLFSRFLTPGVFTLMALVKEVYVVGYVLISFTKRQGRISWMEAFCIISIIAIVIYWLINGKGEMKGQLASFRQLYLPFAFFLFGRACNLKEEELQETMKFYIRICVIAVIIGLFDLALDTKFWTTIGITRYAELKNNVEHLADGMYRSFYTYDFFGLRIRRMASVLVDPVILGQLLAMGLIISVFCKELFKNKETRYSTIILLSIGLISTLAKGGIVIAVFSICILLGRVAKKKWLSYLLFACGGLSIALFAIRSVSSGLSGSQHINGLITGFQSLIQNPLGNGIGSGGNMADAYGGYAYRTVAGDESYIGSLMVQMGIFGLAINIIFWHRFFYKKRNTFIGKYVNVINIANVALFITSFVNYTAISFSSCFIFIILGASGSVVYKKSSLSTVLGRYILPN